MKSRNPMQGRHAAGTPLGAPVKPPSRTGSASGNFVGTGKNAKTAASAEYKRRAAAPAQNYTKQAEQFTKSAPEPFRNPQPSQNPNPLKPQQSGDGVGRGGAYKPFAGSRVSVSDGYKNVNPASASKNVAPVGITGSRGRGSENGKVAGLAQPKKSGSPFNQAKAKRPSFYGK